MGLEVERRRHVLVLTALVVSTCCYCCAGQAVGGNRNELNCNADAASHEYTLAVKTETTNNNNTNNKASKVTIEFQQQQEQHGGMCPMPTDSLLKAVQLETNCTLDLCHVDADCRAAVDKCCDTGCGLSCVEALKDRPGACPLNYLTRRQMKLCERKMEPENSCFHDTGCPGEEKCCWANCKRSCTNPLL